MHSTFNLKNKHNAFWSETLNVSLTVFTRKHHRVPFKAKAGVIQFNMNNKQCLSLNILCSTSMSVALIKPTIRVTPH